LTVKSFALCAVLAFGAGMSIQAQQPAQPAATSGTANAGALGNAQAVDETSLSLDAQAPAANQAATAAGPNTFLYFLRMIVVLALVVGAMYLVFMLMRRLARPKEATNAPIRVMASTSLGTGKAVHLIGLGAKAWLVGSSEQGVNLISEIDDRELLDELELEAASHKPVAGRDFAGIITGLLAPKRGKGGAPAEPRSFDSGYFAKQRDRLDKFKDGHR